ncbi:unnamed protein product [Medioppia subpectinata]|uniref:Uncharacterized protein n=1 Tax=Medioppia subpectinata TaxID=1979941 RepID=A0A7R9KSK1_9ACAR|nr:unnamed protein product [Medioppia subpectinata]CAG2107839.1 unnamed protein product [Medioppia subpectinata]
MQMVYLKDSISNRNYNHDPSHSSSANPTPNTSSKSSATSGQSILSADEMVEMLKNLAAVNEKLHKWEQSMKKLDTYPDNDINKTLMKDIMEFIDNDKSSTQDKAIYLYGQLAHKCHQQKNFMGAAKAYERAATLRFDNPNILNESNSKDTKTTIQYLESAIVNYDAIHKYRHAGTLHYRCSKILRLMNAKSEEVAKHYCQALEYFTMRNHEVKHRKRIDGLKISCYSSSNNYKRKWDSSQRCSRDIDYYVSKYSRYTTRECDSNRSTDNEDSQGAHTDYFMSGANCSKTGDLFDISPAELMAPNIHHSNKESIISITQHNNQMKQQTNRCIEDRIESAKKLVKKLYKFCPFYSVSTDGEDAGRVYCKICERHLGAVSSTLKNHVNTQEHKQAVEDSISGTIREDQNMSKSGSQQLTVAALPAPPIRSNLSIANAHRPSAIAGAVNSFNAIQQQSHPNPNNSSFDFETFDIQWGFQSPNPMDYCLPTSATTDLHTNPHNSAIIQNKTITNL